MTDTRQETRYEAPPGHDKAAAALAERRAEAARIMKAAYKRQRLRRYNAAQVVGVATTVFMFALMGGASVFEPSSGLSAQEVFMSPSMLLAMLVGLLVGYAYLAVVAERDGDRTPGA